MRRLLREQLRELDVRVLEADDAASAIEVARRERPHAVLLDWIMPGGGGLAALRAITDDPDLAHTRVIMITGLSDPRDAHAARQAGAMAYLVKPVPPADLVAVVREALLGQRRFVRQSPTPGVRPAGPGQT